MTIRPLLSLAARCCLLTLLTLLTLLPACSSPESPPQTTPKPTPTAEFPAHCVDQRPDPSESGIDCGGPECPPCGPGQPCLRAVDCASGQCVAGSCQISSCANERKDATETDVDCGGSLCRACQPGQSCLKSRDCTSLVCADGVCAAPSCYDEVLNGDELDVDCGASGCTGCRAGTPCSDPSQCSSSRCEAGRCDVFCHAGTAECDADLSEECETRITSDPAHCGSCDAGCTLANATPRCVAGACQIAVCEAPFRDCNGEPKDGCETNLERDPDHCGECGAACSRLNAEATCVEGTCALTCDLGFGDCDRDASTGCETALGDDLEHCGGCNRRCTAPGEQTPVCVDGQCGMTP